jgi:hypothetical protein
MIAAAPIFKMSLLDKDSVRISALDDTAFKFTEILLTNDLNFSLTLQFTEGLPTLEDGAKLLWADKNDVNNIKIFIHCFFNL